jgi:hypothetical protein
MSYSKEWIEDFADELHGSLEMSKGRPLSHKEVVKIVTRLSKIRMIDPAASQIPYYIKRSDAWERIKEEFGWEGVYE